MRTKTKPKRSKAYRPKPIDLGAHLRIIAGTKPLDSDQCVDLGLAYHTAYAALRTGRGHADDAQTLALTLNLSMLLAEWGYGEDYLEQVKSAQDWLVRCMARAEATGRWSFDGAAFTPISTALELHDEQLKLVNQSVILKALAEIKRRMLNGDVIEVAA